MMVLTIFAIDCTNIRLFWDRDRRNEITQTTKNAQHHHILCYSAGME